MQLAMQIDVDSVGDDRATDVTCVRPQPGRFECNAYKTTGSGMAERATYRLIDCYNDQWRAVLQNGTESFPLYVVRDRPSDGIKSECFDLDKRYR